MVTPMSTITLSDESIPTERAFGRSLRTGWVATVGDQTQKLPVTTNNWKKNGEIGYGIERQRPEEI